MCTCIPVCASEGNKDKECLCVCKGERERETNREIEKDTVYVCV